LLVTNDTLHKSWRLSSKSVALAWPYLWKPRRVNNSRGKAGPSSEHGPIARYAQYTVRAVLFDSYEESQVHTLRVIESREEVSDRQFFATRSTMPELNGISRTSCSGNQSRQLTFKQSPRTYTLATLAHCRLVYIELAHSSHPSLQLSYNNSSLVGPTQARHSASLSARYSVLFVIAGTKVTRHTNPGGIGLANRSGLVHESRQQKWLVRLVACYLSSLLHLWPHIRNPALLLLTVEQFSCDIARYSPCRLSVSHRCPPRLRIFTVDFGSSCRI
jgi:hypothetical protein